MIISGREAVKRGYIEIDSDEQIQPNGVDITVADIYFPITKPIGEKITDNDYIRIGPKVKKDGKIIVLLNEGRYIFRIKEKVNLNGDRPVIARVYPKSSWMRRGILVHTAIWDWGYTGYGVSLVDIPYAMILPLEPETYPIRFAQIVFEEVETTEKYNGNYMNEGE